MFEAGSAFNYLSAWAMMYLLVSWLLACFYPPIFRFLSKSKANRAAFYTLIYALFAPAAAVMVLIILSVPNPGLSLILDHCHGTQCEPHKVHLVAGSVSALALMFTILCVVLVVCTKMLLRWVTYYRKVRALKRLAVPGTDSYKVLDSTTTLAWCVGFVKPEVILSRGLLDSLSPEQLQVVLDHEVMHVQRRDNLRKWLVHWATIAWPTRYRIRIKKDLSNYTELVCDLAAVNDQEDKVAVLATATALTRLQQVTADGATPDLGKAQASRVGLLLKALRARAKRGKHQVLFVMSSVWLLLVLITLQVGHPLLEWVSGSL